MGDKIKTMESTENETKRKLGVGLERVRGKRGTLFVFFFGGGGGGGEERERVPGALCLTIHEINAFYYGKDSHTRRDVMTIRTRKSHRYFHACLLIKASRIRELAGQLYSM